MGRCAVGRDRQRLAGQTNLFRPQPSLGRPPGQTAGQVVEAQHKGLSHDLFSLLESFSLAGRLASEVDIERFRHLLDELAQRLEEHLEIQRLVIRSAEDRLR